MYKYGVIVIGGGHAGVEATFAIANKGHKVALLSLDKTKLGMMPCNPSLGGPAKGIITREIDALGGMQGLYADKSMIQIKMLNYAKGPAVQALRVQIDKDKYSELILKEMEEHKNITIIESLVESLIVKNKKIEGIILENNKEILSNNVIITTGTYMDSSIMVGDSKKTGGPDGQRTTPKLSQSLKNNNITLQRLKTGTPPRVKTSSIDFSKVEEEVLEVNNLSFSNRSGITLKEQVSCYLTYTNEKTHKIIDEHLEESSMYSGIVNGVGPRYCPSIEDKVVRFRDKMRHQIFYEPETKKGDVIYVNGFSSSMPIYVQEKLLKTLPGMKDAKVLKWAYAIEYDAIDPKQLKHSLELKDIDGLFFAGQVNGTSGYEEAAGQGLIAGINASLKIENKEPLVLRRDQSYIGVLIDDLVIKGTNEPYRMLTSRAEYRLLLRNDNADERLSELGFKIGLVSEKEINEIRTKYKNIEKKIDELSKKFVSSKSEIAKKYDVKNGTSYKQLLTRPHVDLEDFAEGCDYIFEVAVRLRLAGYIKKQKNAAEKMKRLENFKIPENINYDDVANLATEAKMKLKEIRPETIGQMSRISGINPADIQMLMFYLEFRKKKNEN